MRLTRWCSLRVARARRNQISLPCICWHGDGSGVCASLWAPELWAPKLWTRSGRRPLRRNFLWRDFLFCGQRRIGARIHESIDESFDAGSGESLDASNDESSGASGGEGIDESSGEGIGKSVAASNDESLGPAMGKRITARRIGATAAETFRQP